MTKVLINTNTACLEDHMGLELHPSGHVAQYFVTDVLRISTYLDRESLERGICDGLGPSPSPSSKALCHMALALGAHFLHFQTPLSGLKEVYHNPLRYFQAALTKKTYILDQCFSVLNFQASYVSYQAISFLCLTSDFVFLL